MGRQQDKFVEQADYLYFVYGDVFDSFDGSYKHLIDDLFNLAVEGDFGEDMVDVLSSLKRGSVRALGSAFRGALDALPKGVFLDIDEAEYLYYVFGKVFEGLGGSYSRMISDIYDVASDYRSDEGGYVADVEKEIASLERGGLNTLINDYEGSLDWMIASYDGVLNEMR